MLCSYFLAFPARSEDEQPEWVYSLEEAIFTASRIPTSIANVARQVTVITPEQIANSPVHSVQDLLRFVQSVDLRPRGPHGVQADVSIRGGSFEQTLILIDGVKVSDPQTGHHNLDIPLSLHDIERIEILHGQGSSIYGPNAFSGAINIITKRGEKRSFNLETTFGEYDLASGIVSLSLPSENSHHRISMSRRTSGGYRDNTEFGINSFHYRGHGRLAKLDLNLSAGYLDKEFGAYKFYSDRFPYQWEHTTTHFLSAGANAKSGRLTIKPSLHYRRHDDDFVLDRNQPEWYRNRHGSDVYGFDVLTVISSKYGETAVGAEISEEVLESTNLGDHSRSQGGIVFEHLISRPGIFHLSLGAFGYYYAEWGWKLWPGLNLGIPLGDYSKLNGSIGWAFRIPTFTELYYSDPANSGNAELEPEEAATYEVGWLWTKKSFQSGITLFLRDSHNLIDWVRTSDEEPWRAMNITSVSTSGIECRIGFLTRGWSSNFPFTNISAGYTFLHSDRDTREFSSKNALTHLRHQLTLDAAHSLPLRLKQHWKLRYQDRLTQGDHLLVDTRITWAKNRTEAYAEASNLFDEQYEEIGSITMPGRWISFGIRIEI